MGATARVREILSWYRSDNMGVQRNLFQLLNTGRLAGTGKMVILPVDQGFEHGPARTFAANPLGYDPQYHFELAIESGCNAYAAPFGQIAAAHSEYVGQIPVIVKVNNNDSLYSTKNPVPAVTCSVRDALQLGATAIGFTIYPGSSNKKSMFEEIREMGEEARSYGLPVVIWSYPRGEDISSEGETAIDIVTYAAQIAAQLGAHIIKVKPPTSFIEQDAARKVYEKEGIKIETLSDRISHVIQSAFGGRRIVIFSGGAAKGDEAVLEEIKALQAGGAFGSIIGRNSFQRSKEDGVRLLRKIMDVYAAA
ncbi:MAG: class I fructose-bisphosphate aldolase [Bdellovibrionales bacterium]|nr:class I fructose-bisphosphate aldolase [Bdellovibrionales bacterium]